MGLVDEQNRPNYYDGQVRVVDTTGKEIARFARLRVPGPRGRARRALVLPEVPLPQGGGLEGACGRAESGVYRAAPLARLNVADGMSTPLAQEQYERMMSTLGGRPVHHTLAYHWARVIEMVNAAEAALALGERPGDHRPRDPRDSRQPRPRRASASWRRRVGPSSTTT